MLSDVEIVVGNPVVEPIVVDGSSLAVLEASVVEETSLVVLEPIVELGNVEDSSVVEPVLNVNSVEAIVGVSVVVPKLVEGPPTIEVEANVLVLDSSVVEE